MNHPTHQPSHHEQLFTQKSINSFSKRPYLWQEAIGGGIISCSDRNIALRQLCVRPTGGGKTLLYNVVAAYLKGVTIMISPFLSLGADQICKLLKVTVGDRSIIFSSWRTDPNRNRNTFSMYKEPFRQQNSSSYYFTTDSSLKNRLPYPRSYY